MLAIDHVIVVVHDLDAAARRFDEQHGLASVAGGRHAGHGTGNRIVPLGSSYIELMAVVDPDEAAFSPLGAWLARRLVEVVGDARGALPAHRRHRGGRPTNRREPLPMRRTRPDGVELAWTWSPSMPR